MNKNRAKKNLQWQKRENLSCRVTLKKCMAWGLEIQYSRRHYVDEIGSNENCLPAKLHWNISCEHKSSSYFK